MTGAEAEDGGGSWQEMMRRILPPGTAVPEAPPNLDYSIALEYHGPPVPYELPRDDPVEIPTAEPASGPQSPGGLPVEPQLTCHMTILRNKLVLCFLVRI